MTKKDNRLRCSCCATDITGFAAYDDPPEGLLCYVCARLVSDHRAGRLDLDDPVARKRYEIGRFELVKNYLSPIEDIRPARA